MPGRVGLTAGSKLWDVKGAPFYILVSGCLAQYLKLKCNRAGMESVPFKTASTESLEWGGFVILSCFICSLAFNFKILNVILKIQ